MVGDPDSDLSETRIGTFAEFETRRLIFATMDGTVATIICLSSWGFGSKNVAAQVDPSKLQYDV
jgi:hypothetical protein